MEAQDKLELLKLAEITKDNKGSLYQQYNEVYSKLAKTFAGAEYGIKELGVFPSDALILCWSTGLLLSFMFGIAGVINFFGTSTDNVFAGVLCSTFPIALTGFIHVGFRPALFCKKKET